MKTLNIFVASAVALLACGIASAKDENTKHGTGALDKDTTGSFNTADGYRALFGNTTGDYNAAIGFESLYSSTTASGNTAVGANALFFNTTGNGNAATGYEALYSNTSGYANTANGWKALYANTTGVSNTATGEMALTSNTTGVGNTADGGGALNGNSTGGGNTATGVNALYDNSTGSENTADGSGALFYNAFGDSNTADGYGALNFNSTGNGNTAVGYNALNANTGGNGNIAIGNNAGASVTGSNDIDIGNQGMAADQGAIRIGTQGAQTQTFVAGIFGATVAAGGVPVYVDGNGTLGTLTSSGRFKRDIEDMGSSSEAILALRPVTFRYKPQIDPSGTRQFGLVAEEVEKISPDLVVYDSNHRVYSVRYEAVNAMLLNEFRKQHDRVEEQTRIIAEQQNAIAALTARLGALEKASVNK